MINNDCEFEKEYSFLKVYEPEGKEHYEVTKEAMTFVHDYYEYYKQNYKEPEERSQMTTSGWSISRKEPYKDKEPYKGKEKPCINVVADVFTTPNAFSKDLKDADGMALLKCIYHTVGNFIPIPEGANFRPGSQGEAGNSDHYEFKLNKIKEFFDKESDLINKDEIDQISKRIKIGYSLGSARQNSLDKYGLERLTDDAQLRYWIQLEWKGGGKTWKDFVEENYLQDFVDSDSSDSDDWKPLKFDGENPLYLLDLCARIIRRGYRISHKGKLDKVEINKLFDHLDSKYTKLVKYFRDSFENMMEMSEK